MSRGVVLVEGDITAQEVDAIVNAANTRLGSGPGSRARSARRAAPRSRPSATRSGAIRSAAPPSPARVGCRRAT